MGFKPPEHIVITGASSGIGEALAKEYAAPGVMLSLIGRDEGRLQEVVKACESKGAQVHSARVDVADQDNMTAVMEDFWDRKAVDLVIANAGISAGTGNPLKMESDDQVRSIFDVNLSGVLNTVQPFLPKMAVRGQGQIALMSSLAGFYGFPGAPAYCASKAAVRIYGESLRTGLVEKGILVNIICPGFVRSRMTDANDFPMPFLMEADRAAQFTRRGLKNNKKIIVFPMLTYFLVRFVMALPSFLADRITGGLPSKPQKK